MKVAVILALGLLLAAQTAAADCSAARDPEITVATKEAPIRTDRSFSHDALARRVGGVKPGWSAFGLTEAAHETEVNYGFVIVPAGNRYCATFDSVAVTVTLSLVVHYASELRPGTCADRAIVGHERQHVDLEHRMLPLARVRVDAAVAGMARRGATGKTVKAATEALQAAMSDVIERALKAFAAEKNRGHGAFDTPEEYTRLTRRCSPGEIRALLGG